MKTLIITGATGHVGTALLKTIDLKAYHVVIAAIKNDPYVKYLPHDIEIRYGDIRDKNYIHSLIGEDNIVIHLAGIISIKKDQKDLVYSVNVNGTKNIADECLIKHSKLVYVSSVHALKVSKKDLVNENNGLNTDSKLGIYEKSKALATQYVKDKIKEGLIASIIYPSGIIGKDDYRQGELATLLEVIASNRMPASVKGGYAFVDVYDVAKAINKIIENNIWNDSFIISGEYKSITDIMKITEGYLNKKRHIVTLPRLFAYLAIPFYAIMSRIKKEKPLFTRYSLKTIDSNANFDTTKMRNILNIHPKAIKESIKETLLFLKKQKAA
jgi:dihydroflavonol-4-reductase